MTALIVEDEKPAARRLANLLTEVDPDIQIMATTDAVETTLEWLASNPLPQIIFMDIHLADGSSFSIFKKMKIDSPVIFVTAYDEYALEAFKVNSIDYLLKPVKKENLETAIQKYKNMKQSFVYPDLENLGEDPLPRYKNRFVIKLGNKIKTVPIEEIAYFISKDKLSFICDKEGKSYPIDLSLDKLEGLIDPELFFRVNRQIITHNDAITDIQTSAKSRIQLTLHPPCQIEAIISSERASLFKKWLKKE
jgi:DNA-binding LytR/AlgR family response regulator